MKRGETKLGSTRPILIHLPVEMIQQLDAAADLFGIYRAEIIRRSLSRELSTVLGDEIQRVDRAIGRKVKPTKGSAPDKKASRGRWRWFAHLLSGEDP